MAGICFGGGVYVLTSHCKFKTCLNVPHVNKTVTDFGGIYTDILPSLYAPGAKNCCKRTVLVQLIIEDVSGFCRYAVSVFVCVCVCVKDTRRRS